MLQGKVTFLVSAKDIATFLIQEKFLERRGKKYFAILNEQNKIIGKYQKRLNSWS
jgi:hypothetical protein